MDGRGLMTIILDEIRRSTIFSGLPQPLTQLIAKHASVQEAAQGSTIFIQGEPPDAMFLVVSGWIKLSRMAVSGAEAVVAVKTRGSSFGEAVAIGGVPYPVNAEAVTAAVLIRIDARPLRHLVDTEPKLARALLTNCFMKLQGFVTQVEQLKARSGTQRVAGFLIGLCGAAEGPAEVELPYNKALIAGRLGIKPESLSRAFKRLRDHGVRIEGNRAFVDDVAALSDLIAEDPGLAWARK